MLACKLFLGSTTIYMSLLRNLSAPSFNLYETDPRLSTALQAFPILTFLTLLKQQTEKQCQIHSN